MTENIAFLITLAALSGIAVILLRGWWLAIADARRTAAELERADFICAGIDARRRG